MPHLCPEPTEGKNIQKAKEKKEGLFLLMQLEREGVPDSLPRSERGRKIRWGISSSRLIASLGVSTRFFDEGEGHG